VPGDYSSRRTGKKSFENALEPSAKKRMVSGYIHPYRPCPRHFTGADELTPTAGMNSGATRPAIRQPADF